MDTLSYKTISANKATVQKEWVLIDAENEVVGRMASKVAKILRGKHRPDFTPHVDCGDNVIIINADKARLTGKKWTDRVIYRYTNYPGGRRDRSPKAMFEKDPTSVVMHAVRGMLPKNRLGNAILKNLRVYAGPEHPHEAQEPKKIDLKAIK